MYKIIKLIPKKPLLQVITPEKCRHSRTFLSQAYYCDEVWNQRFNSPIIKRVNVEELYYELDQRYSKTKQLSALDVDILINSIRNEHQFTDEILDIVHKLRNTADTGNTPDSLTHAVVRHLLAQNRSEELLNVLDDRLNYGLFLDNYTTNILMDIFWKSKEFANGARVASQLMLQEDLDHPLACDLALLHCYKYLQKPEGWPEYVPPEEPEDEVKIRVKYLRNPYDDRHFDLKDPKQIVGKTLIAIAKGKSDALHESFFVLGLSLFEEADKVKGLKVNNTLYKEILDLVPDDNEAIEFVKQFKTAETKVEDLLIENVKKSYQRTSESDISMQCKTFQKWESDRQASMEVQKKRLETAKRLENIADLKKVLKAKEERLWFFENEENIDLELEGKKKFFPKRWFGHKKKPKEQFTEYVPPEVHRGQPKNS